MSDRDLTRDLVGRLPPPVGVCRYCGGPAPQRAVCAAHADLSRLDPHHKPAVNTATTTRTEVSA